MSASASSLTKWKKGNKLTTPIDTLLLLRSKPTTWLIALRQPKTGSSVIFFDCGAHIVVLLWNMMGKHNVLPHEVSSPLALSTVLDKVPH